MALSPPETPQPDHVGVIDILWPCKTQARDTPHPGHECQPQGQHGPGEPSSARDWEAWGAPCSTSTPLARVGTQTHSCWAWRTWWGQLQPGASREDLRSPVGAPKAACWQGWRCCSGCTHFAGAACPHQGSAHPLPMGLHRVHPHRGTWGGVGCPWGVQAAASVWCHIEGFILPRSGQRAGGRST